MRVGADPGGGEGVPRPPCFVRCLPAPNDPLKHLLSLTPPTPPPSTQGMTALTLVTEAYPVARGDFVLVHAAAGGTGQVKEGGGGGGQEGGTGQVGGVGGGREFSSSAAATGGTRRISHNKKKGVMER